MNFNNRVAVITGAGNGLGRAYALYFASRGAKVVVNDLGGGMRGEDGGSSRAADKVVEEIKKAGGEAVANYDSVTDGGKIIETALAAYGRVDIVVNNAGILRDVSFHKMADKDWDLLDAVHLRGAYAVTRAAWPHMRKQKYGRVIMVTSAAGLYGNFGQAHYSAMKLAVVGFANTLAKEGAKANIKVNCIAPLAGSRMTETVMPPDLVKALSPEYVAPLVAALCHESNEANGGIFEAGAGWIAQLRWQRSKGVFLPTNNFQVEQVAAALAAAGDFSEEPSYPTSTQDSFGPIMGNLNNPPPPAAPSAPTMDYKGRVAVITGAGNGLGRAYALYFASRGAKVVVNDLGGGMRGEDGGSSRAADKVVEEIKKAGGEAVPNYDSVTDGGKIIETALAAYGRVDIVVNNAGILRDVSFHKLTDKDWDLLDAVHLRGAYAVTRAAWPHMRKQKYGRVIMVTSAAGLYGNFGQAHYSAMKLAVVGFANTLAKEGAKANIMVNTIAPIAGSRMTETVMPPDMVKALSPDYVAPLVAALCHESNTEHTGGIYEAGAGWIAKLRWQRSKGAFLPLNNMHTEQVAAAMPVISNFEDEPSYPTSGQDSIGQIMANLENTAAAAAASASASAPSSKKGKGVDVDAVMRYQFPVGKFSYTEKDLILYALGVGASRDPLDQGDLQFTYENHPNFCAVPSFGVCVGFDALGSVMNVDGLSFNPMMLLHGEQYTELKKPLPLAGTFTNHTRLSGLYDKGKATVVQLEVTTRDAAGEDLILNRYTVFIRGIGGFGGAKSPKTEKNDPPQRPPDVVHREPTWANQAILYRLSGDMNPLHIDPDMAAMGGFDRPILHGLCTFGFATRAVVRHFCDNDATKFKSIQVRFAKSVYPGETIVTEMWRESPTKIIVRCKVAERGDYVITNAVVMLHGDAATGGGGDGDAAAATSAKTPFKAEPVFAQMKAGLSADIVKKVNASYRFDLTNESGDKRSWLVDLKSGAGSLSEVDAANPPKASCMISMSDSDFVDLIGGKLDPQSAFMKGAIKIKGNMMLAQKLQLLTKQQSKL